MFRPFAHPVARCWMLLRVVAQSLKPVILFSQQLPRFLLFRDRRSVAQQCWIPFHTPFNIVGATHAHDAWITKTHGLYPSHDALQVSTLLGVVASVCTPLPTPRNNSQHCWPSNVGSCWVRLHAAFNSLIADHRRVPSNDPRNNCGTHFAPSFLLVSKVSNCWTTVDTAGTS